MAKATEVIFLLSDNTIELSGLKDEITGTLINDATVTVTLKDKNDVNVVGETWPLAMTALGTGGIYRAVLKDTLTLTLLDRYKAIVDVTTTGGTVGKWTIPAQVTLREE